MMTQVGRLEQHSTRLVSLG